MKILLCNDDGYYHEGLLTLHRAISQVAEVVVVAPEENCSGFSSKLTLRRPIRVTTRDNGFLSVNGSPADCVHLAITGMLDELPDMVISGINNGENMGADVVYSGTVAAAIEGRFLRLPAMALSLAGSRLLHYETAARVAAEMVSTIEDNPGLTGSVLNINVPDVPHDQLEGIVVTRLGSHHQSHPIVVENPDEGGNIYRIGPSGAQNDASEGTDFHAVVHNKVSVTPISIDMTWHQKINQVDQWLNPDRH